MAEMYLSEVTLLGTGKQRYMSALPGGVYASGYDSTRSGSPKAQPPLKSSGVGRSDALPSGAPLSIHLPIVSISSCDSTRRSAMSPHAAAGFHGGIWRVLVINLICSASAAASRYVISENGAMSPGWWHVWQGAWKMR